MLLQKLQTQPESVRSRSTFMKHDSFEPQPINDADVQFIR